MEKIFIYLTKNDLNWLKGFQYFIDEWQLNYKLIHFENVEDVKQLNDEIKSHVEVIILDWELSEINQFNEKAFLEIQKMFPFIPVMAFSEFEISKFCDFYVIKKLNDPDETFNKIVTAINFFRNDWILKKVNRIIYYVERFTSDHDLKNNKEEIPFYHTDPLVARQKALDYFKETPKTFQISLAGFETDPALENILPYPSSGGLTIYSIFLHHREILANLKAEYVLYSQNGFKTTGSVQNIFLPGMSIPLKVLIGISNEKGEIYL